MQKDIKIHKTNTKIDVTIGLLSTNRLTRKTLENRVAKIISGAINPKAQVSTNPRTVINGEAENGAEINIKIEGGEEDNSSSIPKEKRGNE